MLRNKLIFRIILISAILIFNKCGSLKYQAGREYLVNGADEQKKYGLYSYFLFSKRPDEHQKIRYIAVIESYLNSIEKIEKHEENYKKSELNICYIPVETMPDISFENLNIKEKSVWILDNYDYARARYFLNKIDPELLKGPYIISYEKPLSKVTKLKTKFLFQNMSNVEPELISLWIDEFLKQSSKVKYWDEKHLNNFTNDLRNLIAIAAEGLDKISKSLKWWEETIACLDPKSVKP
jgi:hypothetical protein